jgi:hypothetical protein
MVGHGPQHLRSDPLPVRALVTGEGDYFLEKWVDWADCLYVHVDDHASELAQELEAHYVVLRLEPGSPLELGLAGKWRQRVVPPELQLPVGASPSSRRTAKRSPG